jgi:hypothetical protein
MAIVCFQVAAILSFIFEAHFPQKPPVYIANPPSIINHNVDY